jgi:predicted TPR repeat methyltransferase
MLNVSFGVDGLVQRAQQALANGQLAQARDMCLQALQQQANHPLALHVLGAIALHADRPDVAVDFFRRAEAAQPENAALHCDLATAWRETGHGTEAIRHYRLALALQPDLALAREMLEETLAAAGNKGVGAVGDVPDAEYVTALNDRAARVAKTNPLLAIQLFGCSLDAAPEQPAVLVHMGALCVQQGQWRGAVDVLRSAVRLGRRTADVWHNLAKALRKRSLLEEALEAARESQALDPADMDVQLTMKQILQDVQGRDALVARLRKDLAAHPDSEEIRFQLATVTDDVDLSTMPLERVRKLFDGYAGNFEKHLLTGLKYRGHEQLWEAVAGLTEGVMGAKTLDILDLGCGTGLCGVKFKPLARYLKGVDVAPAMIEQARKRGIYDDLETGELAVALAREAGRNDLILAADVLEYVGNLEGTFAAAAKALRAGGWFAFTVEKTDQPGFVFSRRTHTFAHSLTYVRELAEKFGLREISAREHVMRVEGRTPLQAWAIVLRKQ